VDLASFKTSQFKTTISVFSVLNTANNVIEMMKNQAKKKKIEIKLLLSVSENLWVKSDQTCIEQVLVNILNIVIKTGSVCSTVTLKISLDKLE